MKNNIFKILFLTTLITLSSCETFDLDQIENPSQIAQDQLDPIFVFNYVQLQLPNFVNSANSFTQRVTRQMAMTGGNTYENAFAPVNFNNNWTTGYLMLNAIKTMNPKATENKQYYIIGVSKVIRCYVLMTMVDMYGDIPYSDALQGNSNLTPKYDKSAAVYAGIYDELNQAILDLKNPDNNGDPAFQSRDLYYGNAEGIGNPANWITLANTLKLKMLNNARLVGTIGTYNVVSEITSLLSTNDLIDTPAEDFEFKYGTNRVNPNSRHPLYNDHYELGGGAYISNYFMWAVSKEKDITFLINEPKVVDPREPFYFFKQAGLSGTLTNTTNLPCRYLSRPVNYDDGIYSSFYDTSIKAPYCTTAFPTYANAYLGRDHGDNSGIPADDELRTVVGIYPCGGEIGSPINVNSNTNAGLKGEKGRGIMPMVLSSYVNFMKAEAKLTLGISSVSDTRAELEQGIRSSISKTTSFIPMPSDAFNDFKVLIPPSIIPVIKFNENVENYVAYVLGEYDSASTAKKLEIIMKEFYIASWGNGIETYNNYRRTGYPSNFQPTLEETSGNFFSTALYAGDSVNNNPNAPANVRTKKVFWDTAGLTLH